MQIKFPSTHTDLFSQLNDFISKQNMNKFNKYVLESAESYNMHIRPFQ